MFSKMRAFKKLKVILVSVCLFLSLLTAVFYYANTVFVPRFLQKKIIEEISAFTSSKVTLDSARLSIFKGLILKNLVICDPAAPDQQLANIKELSATILIWPFFKEKSIILPSLKLNGLTLSLSRNKDSLNITSLTDKISNENTASPSILVRSLSVGDSLIHWTDQTFTPSVSAMVHVKQAEVKIGATKVRFSASGLVERNKAQVSFSADGAYLFSKSLKGRFLLHNLDLKNFPEYLALLPVHPRQGILDSLKGELTWQEQNNISGKCELRVREFELSFQDYELTKTSALVHASFSGRANDFLALKTDINLTIEKGDFQAKAPLQATVVLDGSRAHIKRAEHKTEIISELDLTKLALQKDDLKAQTEKISLSAETTIEDAKPEQFTLKGQTRLGQTDLQGLPSVDMAKIESAELSFTQDSLSCKDAVLEVFGSKILAQGHYQNKILTADVSGKLETEKLLPLIRKYSTLPLEKLSGSTDLALHITSDADNHYFVSGKAEIEKPFVLIKNRPEEWKASYAKVLFDTEKQTAEWDISQVMWLERSFNVKGSLENFEAPSLRLTAHAENMNLETQLKKTGGIFDVSSLKARIAESELTATGKWDTETETLHINANADINLEDLKEWIPDKKMFEEPLNLKGRCTLQLDGSGPVKDWKAWTIRSSFLSKLLKIRGFSLSDISGNYTQLSGKGFLNFLHMKGYGGTCEIKGSADLVPEKPTYQLSGEIKKLDLNLLKSDIPEMKDKVFSGTTGIKAVLSGTGAEKETLKGQAQISIKNGNIWEFNPLKGLGDFLFIPRFNSLVFTQASGDLYLEEGWMRTDNLEFVGPDLSLLVQGKMGLDGKLDLLAMTQVQSTGPENAAQAVGMTGIGITGTVQKPQYKLQPLTQSIMKKLGDILSNITP